MKIFGEDEIICKFEKELKIEKHWSIYAVSNSPNTPCWLPLSIPWSGLIIHNVLLRVHSVNFQWKQQIRHDLYIDEGYISGGEAEGCPEPSVGFWKLLQKTFIVFWSKKFSKVTDGCFWIPHYFRKINFYFSEILKFHDNHVKMEKLWNKNTTISKLRVNF